MSQSPPNDYWASPTAVELQTDVLSGTVPDGTTYYTNLAAHIASYNIGATAESGEQQLGSATGVGTPGRSVWFNFVPQQSGYLNISTTNSTFKTQCGLKLASAGVAGSWTYSSIAYSGTGCLSGCYVTAGTSYMIDVNGTSAGQGYS